MMKRFIKWTVIVFVVIGICVVLFDDLLIKYSLKYTFNKVTQKKSQLDSVHVSYFPNFNLVLNGLKIPAKNQNKFLLTAQSIEFDINIGALFSKSLIINKCVFNGVKINDDSIVPDVILPKSTAEDSSTSGALSNLNFTSYVNQLLSNISSFNVETPSLNEQEIATFSTQVSLIAQDASASMNQIKNDILVESNSIQYAINSINTSEISGLDQLDNVKNIDDIELKVDEMNLLLSSLKTVYVTASDDIQLIKDDLTNYFDSILNDLSVNVAPSTENILSNQILVGAINGLIKSIQNNDFLNQRSDASVDDSIDGITYHFPSKSYNKFLIKQLVINEIDDSFYVYSEHITKNSDYNGGPFIFDQK